MGRGVCVRERCVCVSVCEVSVCVCVCLRVLIGRGVSVRGVYVVSVNSGRRGLSWKIGTLSSNPYHISLYL